MKLEFKAVEKAFAIACFTLILARVESAGATEDLDVSGFARIVAGAMTDDVQFNGFDNSIDFAQDSLLGLRADYAITDSVHVVAQAILRSNQSKKSNLQWLYLDYRPINQLHFKLGRQRLPMFQYSEVIDVGFAYPWITLPLEIYSPFIFSEFDGIFASYEYSNAYFSGSVDAYYGGFDGDITVAASKNSADIDNLRGIVLQANRGQYSFRVSQLFGNVSAEIQELVPFQQALNQLGFVESAALFNLDNSARYTQVSGSWEDLDYFFKFEFSHYNSDAFFIPKSNSFYTSFGYNFYPFTAHLTLAKSDVSFDEPPKEIPIGLDPQLDFLAQQFAIAISAVPLNDMESVNLGLRYDLSATMALKTDITFFEGQEIQTQSIIQNELAITQDTQLVKVALEWVF